MRIAILAVLATTACMVGGEGDELTDPTDGKADATGTCSDPKYNDGTCHLGLACNGMPDIDCFHSYASDAAAYEAQKDFGDIAPLTNPLQARARKLLDRTWDAYKQYYALGKLEEIHMAALVIDDGAVNAAVTADPDTQRQLATVFFNSGILAPEYTDDMIIGVVAHELGHMVRLHSYGDVGNSIIAYYAAGSTEPIGAVQRDQLRLRAYGTRFQDLARLGGADSRAELGGLPTGGHTMNLLLTLVEQFETSTNTTCKTNAATAREVWSTVVSEIALDESVKISATTQADAARVQTLLDACKSTVGTLQEYMNANPGSIDAAMIYSPHPELAAQNVVDAIFAATTTKRAALRALATEFQQKEGKPLGLLRYYSAEEQADDIAVRVTKKAGTMSVGAADLTRKSLGAELATECDTLRSKGMVPYGIHLNDDHHGACWRIAHAHQYAKSLGYAARATDGAEIDASEIDPFAGGEAFEPTEPPSYEMMH